MGVVKGGRREWNKALGEEEDVGGLLVRSLSIFMFSFSFFFVFLFGFARLIPVSCGYSPPSAWVARREQSERDPFCSMGFKRGRFWRN